MTLTVMNVVRIAKVIALLAFFLPWVAVSCQNVDLATASGLELMQGKMSPNPQAEQQMKQQMNSALGGLGGLNAGNDTGSAMSSTDTPELGVNPFAIAAAVVILIGLGLSFAGKGKTAGRNVLVSSLLGMALAYGTVWWFRESAIRDMEAKEGGGMRSAPMSQMDAAGTQMVNSMLQERYGYWVVIVALIVAAGAGGIAMAGGPAAAKPEQTPPA